MAQYIDKDALVAKIEKELSYYKDLEDRGIISEAGIAAYRVIRLLKSDIDSLEVKEVDLNKEIDNIWNPRFNLGWDDNSLISINHKSFESIAKHFFELGLKAQKGE